MNLPWTSLGLVALVLYGCAAVGGNGPDGDAEARRIQAAQRFLATLDPAQRERAKASFEAAERRAWDFVPKARPGVRLGDLDTRQRTALHELLDTTLSSQGHLKVEGIVRLEDVLFELESKPGAPASHRDPGQYSIRVFGSPGTGPWAWKFEGHHVSLNFTSTEAGPSRTTPFFLGVSPARIPAGKYAGARVLIIEEDLGREILLALDEGQRASSRLAGAKPSDVILGPSVDRCFEHVEGVRVGDLRPEQQGLVTRLLDEFAQNLAPDLCAQARQRFAEDGVDALRFGWNGGTGVGEAHYWRIVGSKFAIEFADVDGGSNHFHCVWRDFERDFGADLLREHLEHDHAHSGH